VTQTSFTENDPVEKAISLFHQSIATRAEHGEMLAAQLADASELLSTALLNDGRLLVCGYGNSSLQAQYLVTLLLSQHQRERPALPALLLSHCMATLTAIGQHYGPNDLFSRQIHTLGQTNDVLVIYTATGNPQSLLNAVQAAHERNMRVLCLTGREGGHLSQLLENDDLDIQAPVSPDFLVNDIHQLMTAILCELIEDRLFGQLTHPF
jgi:D-sedoheptulose 7-phosphate isomerase